MARKVAIELSQVRRYLEPGPVVLVSSRHGDACDIMAMGWHTVMEFTPSLVGCVISSANHSFELIRASGECVINLPTTALIEQVLGIGSTSGADIGLRAGARPRDRRMPCPIRMPAARRQPGRALQFFYLGGGRGTRTGGAETPGKAALQGRRHVHGIGQDHPPAPRRSQIGTHPTNVATTAGRAGAGPDSATGLSNANPLASTTSHVPSPTSRSTCVW